MPGRDASNPEPSHEPVVDPNDTVEVPLGRIAGNVITNEFFDPSDPTMSMSIMSSYPLDKMMVFACCDYDPERTLFELAPPYMTEGDQKVSPEVIRDMMMQSMMESISI